MTITKGLLAGAALLLGGLALAPAPAEAYDGWRYRHGPPPRYWHGPPPRPHYYRPPPRVYYAPPPRRHYYQPRPYYYRAPPPGVYRRF
jgi:hypothetical protein